MPYTMTFVVDACILQKPLSPRQEMKLLLLAATTSYMPSTFMALAALQLLAFRLI